ncbi:hypothetical protein BC940DRAFT_338071 [Gongronella butleri]|nr:hypothetical protein BC940DRAFT_338071 [Gongronella butleri]
MTDAAPTTPIRTLSFEHVPVRSKCVVCNKTITPHTFTINTMTRASKKEKKKNAKNEHIHFKCWAVPIDLQKKPLEMFRGYASLRPEEKSRISKMIEAGAGTMWADIVEKERQEREKQEKEQQEEEGDEQKSKVAANESKKRKASGASADDEPSDMTTALTGMHAPSAGKSNKKVKTDAANDTAAATKTPKKDLASQKVRAAGAKMGLVDTTSNAKQAAKKAAKLAKEQERETNKQAAIAKKKAAEEKQRALAEKKRVQEKSNKIAAELGSEFTELLSEFNSV